MTLSLLNEIKIEIRSLLISSKNGLNEDELCRDYSLFNSQRSIPYEIFGYLTITDFLNSLTDILYRSSDGHIHPIVDQSTEHIFKFVQQRTKKKSKPKSISYNQQLKPSFSRNKHTRATPVITSIHPTVDAIKPFPMIKRTKKTYDKERYVSQIKPTKNDPSPKFERIHVTNEFLRNLLIHFQKQTTI